MSILAWIVLGLIAGFIASKLVNRSGGSLVLDLLLGVVGAFVGGFLFTPLRLRRRHGPQPLFDPCRHGRRGGRPVHLSRARRPPRHLTARADDRRLGKPRSRERGFSVARQPVGAHLRRDREEGRHELVLVRHGLPERSDATADPPLCAEGHDQAARVARWLAQEAFDVVYSSPMHRAVQTAQPFEPPRAAMRSAPIPASSNSTAIRASTSPWRDLKREDYPRWKAMVDGGFDTDIVGFQAMVVAALEEIVEAHPGQRVAVFCHGGVINVWTAHVLGMAPRLFFGAPATPACIAISARGAASAISLRSTNAST